MLWFLDSASTCKKKGMRTEHSKGPHCCFCFHCERGPKMRCQLIISFFLYFSLDCGSLFLENGRVKQIIMDCVYCGEPLTIDDLARHDCGRADELTDPTDGVCELYQRLVVQPYVTLDDAFSSTFHDEHKRDEQLHQALSYLVTGPPLSTTTTSVAPRRHALTHRHAQLFMAAATATLMRVKSGDDNDNDYLHYRQPPLGYTLLAAVCRQATRAEHVVPLLAALSLPTVTPHLTLEENCWNRYDQTILSDVSIVSKPQLLKALEQAIEKITFVRDDADWYDARKVSSSFLWKDKDEFVVSVLHV
ncbi:Hypothetical protein, putative, partial [Bodo saltans]